jgi:hypothetical protein
LIAVLLTGTLLVALLLAVLAPALHELRRPTDVAPLNVPRDHDNAANRFALHYRERLEQALQAPLVAALQHPDAAERAAQRGLQWCAAGSQAESAASTSRPLVGAGDLVLAAGSVHPHEVYAARDLRLASGASARAAFAEGELRVDRGASVSRWAHARDVVLGPLSQVGARVSAEHSITLEDGAQFLRARAPTIGAPRLAAQAHPSPPRSPVHQRFAGAPGARFDVSGARWLVDGDLSLPAGAEIEGDLIVHGNAAFAADCLIRGSLKVHGRLDLGDGCVIDGACVVVGPAQTGAQVRMAGPLVGEGLVRIGADSTIGRIDAETSVNGRLISLAPGVTVHGSIWAKVGAGVSA